METSKLYLGLVHGKQRLACHVWRWTNGSFVSDDVVLARWRTFIPCVYLLFFFKVTFVFGIPQIFKKFVGLLNLMSFLRTTPYSTIITTTCRQTTFRASLPQIRPTKRENRVPYKYGELGSLLACILICNIKYMLRKDWLHYLIHLFKKT